MNQNNFRLTVNGSGVLQLQ